MEYVATFVFSKNAKSSNQELTSFLSFLCNGQGYTLYLRLYLSCSYLKNITYRYRLPLREQRNLKEFLLSALNLRPETSLIHIYDPDNLSLCRFDKKFSCKMFSILLCLPVCYAILNYEILTPAPASNLNFTLQPSTNIVCITFFYPMPSLMLLVLTE